MNKTKVLVFTRFDKLMGLSSIVKNRILPEIQTWSDAYPKENKPIVKCDFSNHQTTLVDVKNVDIKLLDDDGLFLVYDSINETDKETLKGYCDGDFLYVLTHTSGGDNSKKSSFNDWKAQVLPGIHTPNKEDHYSPLFEILTDDQPEKLNRIIDTIFKPYNKLDAVLQFLHGCLVPNNVDDSFLSAYKRLLDDNDLKGIVEDFYENIYPNQQENPKKYIEKLAEFCNELLKIALTQN